ncbi:MAG: hypothetical protein Dbin4_02700, partial [Alphaproteobacteria bacterium]|nr:hypothetical protein [Alphaproteobacteria bacterium]
MAGDADRRGAVEAGARDEAGAGQVVERGKGAVERGGG